MKKFFIVLSLLFSINSLIAKGSDYDIYLCIGQSNMSGRALMIEEDYKPLDNVFLLNDKGEIEPAVAPLNRYSTIKLKPASRGNINFINSVSFSTPIIASKTGRKILIVMNARGGSNIDQWQKDAANPQYYNDAVSRTKQALEYGELKAILWHQGESNRTELDAYIPKLSKLVTSFREEFNNKKLPIVIGELGYWVSDVEKFNSVLMSVKKHIPYSDCVSAEGTDAPARLANLHFTRDGMKILGERYAEKVLKMVYKMK